MENATADQLITLKISGDELEKSSGYNLRYILDSLSSLEKMVDKTYLYTQNKSRMSDLDKDNISIRLMDVKEGSFVAEMAIQMKDFILPISPLLAENPMQIWDAIKNAYTYIKEFLKAKEEGKTVDIQMNNNQNGIHVVNTGNGTVEINVHPAVAGLAENISPILYDISNKVDGENVSSIDFIENDEVSLSFGEEEKKLFKKRTFVDDDFVHLTGKITKPNFAGLTGKIEIYDNQEGVPGGVYTFNANKDNMNDENLWKEIYLVEKSYICQKKVSFSTSQGFKEVVEEIVLFNVLNEE